MGNTPSTSGDKEMMQLVERILTFSSSEDPSSVKHSNEEVDKLMLVHLGTNQTYGKKKKRETLRKERSKKGLLKESTEGSRRCVHHESSSSRSQEDGVASKKVERVRARRSLLVSQRGSSKLLLRLGSFKKSKGASSSKRSLTDPVGKQENKSNLSEAAQKYLGQVKSSKNKPQMDSQMLVTMLENADAQQAQEIWRYLKRLKNEPEKNSEARAA